MSGRVRLGTQPPDRPDAPPAPTGVGVRVAVVDSGWSHRVTDGRIRPGIGLVDPDDRDRVRQSADDDDRIGHGTACADLVLRIAPGAEVMPVRVFGERLETSVPILVAALDWAADNGMRVINLSLGTFRADALRPLYLACERARRQGAVVVAAHRGRATGSLPAVFDNVISVGGGRRHAVSAFAYRPGQEVEVLASGEHTGVRWCDGTRRPVRGSSFAAPVVSGVIACLMEGHPNADVDGIRSLLARLPPDAAATALQARSHQPGRGPPPRPAGATCRGPPRAHEGSGR